MFFDTKSVWASRALLALVLLTAPLANAQAKFPFSIERDSSGTLTRIEIPVRDSMMNEDEDLLTELRVSVKDYQDAGTIGLSAIGADAIVPQSEDDKKLYEQAKAYLKNDLSPATLNDPRLDKAYTNAKAKVLTIKLYRLLAAPNSVGAFDTERAIAEIVETLLSESGLNGPVFSVFEFLVGEYVASLDSRRCFYQNELLSLMANDTTLFTENEKSTIRSSIFYSRLDFTNIFKRSAARKSWSTYGDDQLAKTLQRCKDFVGTGENGFGQCFKQTGDLFVNRLNNKNAISKSVSLAFDSKNPTRVHDFRILLMVAKFGLDMISVPSIAKAPLKSWLESQYEEQRKSEGFFFGYANLKNQPALADWILTNSANPLIRR